jgi:hypothetical protein
MRPLGGRAERPCAGARDSRAPRPTRAHRPPSPGGRARTDRAASGRGRGTPRSGRRGGCCARTRRRKQREPEHVARLVRRAEPPATEDVADRVDAERDVMQDEEPHRAAPQQPRQPGADGPARPASAHGRHVAMQIAMTIRRRSIGCGASVPYIADMAAVNGGPVMSLACPPDVHSRSRVSARRASISARVPETPASDDEEERRSRRLLRDEGSTLRAPWPAAASVHVWTDETRHWRRSDDADRTAAQRATCLTSRLRPPSTRSARGRWLPRT